MALLFGEGRERERKGGHSVGGGPKLTPPKYKCLSKSALAVCVKTLELHPDRSEAAKHAATCVQWYLKRLSAANTEEVMWRSFFSLISRGWILWQRLLRSW